MAEDKEVINIKACPCCGGKGQAVKLRSYFEFIAVICENCGLQTKSLPTLDEAIERWNMRIGT